MRTITKEMVNSIDWDVPSIGGDPMEFVGDKVSKDGRIFWKGSDLNIIVPEWVSPPCVGCQNAHHFGNYGLRCVLHDWSTPDYLTDPKVPSTCPDFE